MYGWARVLGITLITARNSIGHACFGFRVVNGEVIFITVSPNRRHSAMILKLSRTRVNDVGIQKVDASSAARKRFCGKETPAIFSENNIADDPDGKSVSVEMQLPELHLRQALNAQDPIASVHHYLVFMYIILPAILGLRACLQCPHCNIDENDMNIARNFQSCQDHLGTNMKIMGGFAGLATAMCFATEFQGDGTPHGHGFVSLVNMYQHCTLEEIGNMIESNVKNVNGQTILERITAFLEHVQREDHFNDEQHQAQLEQLEFEFRKNNEGPTRNKYLSVHPKCLYELEGKPYLWDKASNLQHATAQKVDEVLREAAEFKRRFEADVQFIFSRVQHHWHLRNAKGEREPMKYCRQVKKNSSDVKEITRRQYCATRLAKLDKIVTAHVWFVKASQQS